MLQQFQRKVILARNLCYGVDVIVFNLYKSDFQLVILQRGNAKTEFICILNMHLSCALTQTHPYVYSDTVHA